MSVWGQHILGSNPVPDSHLDFKQTRLKIQACTDTILFILYKCDILWAKLFQQKVNSAVLLKVAFLLISVGESPSMIDSIHPC